MYVIPSRTVEKINHAYKIIAHSSQVPRKNHRVPCLKVHVERGRFGAFDLLSTVAASNKKNMRDKAQRSATRDIIENLRN